MDNHLLTVCFDADMLRQLLLSLPFLAMYYFMSVQV
jgi:hypothetical protein